MSGLQPASRASRSSARFDNAAEVMPAPLTETDNRVLDLLATGTYFYQGLGIPEGTTMSLKEELRPHKHQLVKKLVADAHVDVRDWSHSASGTVKHPASNPRYCYEWAFTQAEEIVVVILWHAQLYEQDGDLCCTLNLRDWAARVQSSHLKPSQRSAGSKRAKRMHDVLKTAFLKKLPVRVIVGEGARQDLQNSDSATASRMVKRLLDPESWAVTQYDDGTGQYELRRAQHARFIDQFSTSLSERPTQVEIAGKIWKRDPKVRSVVLSRAQGRCELCQKPGFKTYSGEIYLETHHVIPLCEQGADDQQNVVALCPNDHREAHHGSGRSTIERALLDHLASNFD